MDRPVHYVELLATIKARVRAAQLDALRAVNRQLVTLYWDLGRLIVERQQGETWGRSVVQHLAADLQTEFPGVGGFSSQNLWYMRQFFTEYAEAPKLQPLVGEVSWSHNIQIFSKCKEPLEREYYLRMSRRMGWSRDVLAHQIENQSYEKTLLASTSFEHTLPAPIAAHAALAIKDNYTFDFLELGDEHSERQLEAAITARIEPFLREMGGLFAFVGRQFRLEVEGQEYFIDLLLYHRRLRCLVAVELKIGEFIPEHVGKMQFYLALLDDTARQEGEQASIGIILCKSKSRTIVEYALRESNKPIGVASYRMVRTLPERFGGLMPSPEQIARLVEEI